MVEIEIGVRYAQRLNRRVGERETLITGIDTWSGQRNAFRARINWIFTTER